MGTSNSITFIANPNYFVTMMRYFYVINVFLAVSMNSFIFPVTRRIRCHAFRPAGIIGRVGNDYTRRHGYENQNLDFGKRNIRKNPFGRSSSSLSTTTCDDYDGRKLFYESVSSYLFRQGKTWKRLSHLLEMAAGDKDEVITPDTKKSVADIGTDHGLLAMGLALKGNYKQVVGVDVSAQALTYGALALQERIRNQTMSLNDEFLTEYEELPVEFRVGNGLEALEFGEADIIAIAGMGVNVMLQILEHESSMNGTNLEKLGCKRLVLQATNSRPRNLILLYDRLQNRGWKVRDERIEKLSSRWYITTRFELPNDAIRSTQPNDGAGESVGPELPGLKLRSCKDSSMKKVFDEYCQHHKQWIQQDAKVSRQQSDPRELRWMKCFFDEKF